MATSGRLPGPIGRLRDHLRAIRHAAGQARDQTAELTGEIKALRAELDDRLDRLEARLHEQALRADNLERRFDALSRRDERAAGTARSEHAQLVELLRFVLAEPARRAEQLVTLRGSPAYARAYDDPDPLVSIVIPTFDNHEALRTRSIPSALAQTHGNVEVVVVGDGAPVQARRVVEGFSDPRLSYFNLPYRGPYSADPGVLWRVAGAPPFNDALRRARGTWIAMLDDDDAFRPDHIALLLAHARAHRHELAYACLDAHSPDGARRRLGAFPPSEGTIGMQAAIWHAGLAEIFRYELADGVLGLPTDWGMCQRMMEAGVRIGFLDEVTVDYYPSTTWRPGFYAAATGSGAST